MKQFYITIAVLFILVVSHGVAYTKGKQIERGEHTSQALLIADVREQAARGAAEAIAKIEVKNVTIKQEIQREILTNTVYRDCQHNDVGMQLVNEALNPPNRSRDFKLPGIDALTGQ